MEYLDRLFRQIESSRPDMIACQRALSKVPAIAPESAGDGEMEKARVLINWLENLKINDLALFNAPDNRVSCGERPNLVATIPGKKTERSFWIMTHLDVVPPGDLALWENPPYEVVERNGKLYGRGVEDNQQSMVASVYAAASIIKEGLEPNMTVKLLFVSDEEVGSGKGIRYLLENHSLFRENDLILVPDMGNREGSIIEIAEKNMLWLKFRTKGKQCHASTPEKGINAFVAGSELVLKLNDLNRIYSMRNTLFNPPVSTFCPTKKENNIPNINTIPAEDVFYMDCRILPSIETKSVISEIEKCIDQTSTKYGVQVEYSIVNRAESKPTPENTPIVDLLKRAIEHVHHTDPQVVGVGGGTVAALLRNAGYHTVVWSTVEETAHMPNEHCLIDNMVADAKVMAYIMMDNPE